jgi:hypothetical protein
MGNAWVWVAIVVGGLGAAAGLHMALSGLLAREIRLAVVFVLLCLLITPAPVPEYAGSYAPALIILAFEGLFQRGGDPFTALKILLTVAALASGAAVLMVLGWRRWASTSLPNAESADSNL